MNQAIFNTYAISTALFSSDNRIATITHIIHALISVPIIITMKIRVWTSSRPTCIASRHAKVSNPKKLWLDWFKTGLSKWLTVDECFEQCVPWDCYWHKKYTNPEVLAILETAFLPMMLAGIYHTIGSDTLCNELYWWQVGSNLPCHGGSGGPCLSNHRKFHLQPCKHLLHRPCLLQIHT